MGARYVFYFAEDIRECRFSPKNPPVTSVLLSIQGELGYHEDYGYVKVKSLNNINYFLENRKEQFSYKEVNRLTGRMKGDVTK